MRHSFIDKYSDLDSPVHRLPTRLKLILFLFIISVLSFVPKGSWFVWTFFLLFCCAVVFVANIPPGYIFKKSAVVLPFAFFLSLGAWRDWDGFLFLVLRAWLCAAYCILLLATIPFPELLKAFSGYGGAGLIHYGAFFYVQVHIRVR